MRVSGLSLGVLFLGAVTVLGAPPARVQYRFTVTVAPTKSFNCITIPVKVGTRLIVNQASGDVRLPDGERGVIFISAGPITPFPGSTSAINTQHFFPLTAAGANISVGPHAESYYFNEQPEIFSDSDLQICLSRGPTPSPFTLQAGANVALSGRIVTLPE